MGAKPLSFKNMPGLFPNKPDVDAYHGNAFQLFFDENDRVEYIELSKSPKLSVHLQRHRSVQAAGGGYCRIDFPECSI